MNAYTIWFTGLSGSGKTTIAEGFKNSLDDVVHLDGDILREGLCSDLGFSEHDRKENLRRAIEVARLFNLNNIDVIASFITPYEEIRRLAKNRIGLCKIIYIKCPLSLCETRDPKGLYNQVKRGEIKDFTGIDSPYDEPINPDFILDTEYVSAKTSIQRLLEYTKEVEKELWKIEY